jgi:hypothetical protein
MKPPSALMMERVLKKFYSSLLLLAVLCTPERGLVVYPNRCAGWQRFLNDLCWFCDTKTAGKTVVTIAVEQSDDNELIFWVASNEGKPKKSSVKAKQAARHLEWLLARMQIQGKMSASQPDLKRLEELILEEAVHISYEKFRHYIYQLRKLVTGLQHNRHTHTDEEERGTYDFSIGRELSIKELNFNIVHDFAQLLLGLHSMPAKLSAKAYEFRRTELYQNLKALGATQSATARHWPLLRHYIGRLASWAKSARSIARMANCAEFRPFLHTATVQPLASLQAVRANPIDAKNGYHEILRTALPHLPFAQLTERFLASIGPTDGTKAKYAQNSLNICNAKSFQPKVHAEIPMLKHFQQQGGRRFAFDHRYIACSKPPCFCCDLYREICHGDIAFRPRHGNAWVAWSLPCEPEGRLTDGASDVKLMVVEMQRRISRSFYTNPWSNRTPKLDSNTDIDTTLPRTSSLQKFFQSE